MSNSLKRSASLFAKVGRNLKTVHGQRKGRRSGYLLSQKKVWGLVLGFAAYNYTFYLLLTWLPSYLSSAHHIDLFHSAMYTSVPVTLLPRSRTS